MPWGCTKWSSTPQGHYHQSLCCPWHWIPFPILLAPPLTFAGLSTSTIHHPPHSPSSLHNPSLLPLPPSPLSTACIAVFPQPFWHEWVPQGRNTGSPLMAPARQMLCNRSWAPSWTGLRRSTMARALGKPSSTQVAPGSPQEWTRKRCWGTRSHIIQQLLGL